MNGAAKNVWIIDEGSQGHVVQSRGLVRELGRRMKLETEEFTCRFSVKKRWLRSFAKRLMRKCGSETLLRLTHEGSPVPEKKPDLIISSGPNSLLALEYFSRHFGCPSVFVQGSIRVPQGAVTCVVRPFEGEQRDDYVFIPLLFNEITPELLAETRSSYLAEHESEAGIRLRALFVGASSEKIAFTGDDWERLVRMVNELWERDGVKWLIATSYRTGSEMDAFLEKHIHPEAIQEAVWYSSRPKKITRIFLSRASEVYVTMDSLTMMTEAVSSGLPVRVFSPEKFSIDLANTHHRYVAGLLDEKLVHLTDDSVEEEKLSAPAADYGKSIDRILEKIGWKDQA